MGDYCGYNQNKYSHMCVFSKRNVPRNAYEKQPHTCFGTGVVVVRPTVPTQKGSDCHWGFSIRGTSEHAPVAGDGSNNGLSINYGL